MSIQGFYYGDIIHKYDYNALDNLPPEVTEEQITQMIEDYQYVSRDEVSQMIEERIAALSNGDEVSY